MDQIRGVINQAHRNQELETIKNMYHSNSAKNIEENNSDKNSEDNENEDQQDNILSDKEDFELNIIDDDEYVVGKGNWDVIVAMWSKMLDAETDVEKEMEEEDMFEINNNFGDNTVSAYLSNRIHPQRDINAKWKLDKLFSIDLSSPNYCEHL